MNIIIFTLNYIIDLVIKKRTFVIIKIFNIMENKYIKTIQSSIENMQINAINFNVRNDFVDNKWLSPILMITAFILWVVFNIVVTESHQFPPYLLVGMNLILYCMIAAMINPNK